MKIVGECGSICRPGELGELYFLPPGGELPSHYLGARPKQDSEGWVSIGDLAHMDADGYVYLVDRRTDLIIRGGANVYPAEIEAALDEHSGVVSSIVIGLPCEEMGAHVHAIVQTKDGRKIDVADLHEFLKKGLAPYKMPESYELVTFRLRDEAGKVRRSALRDQRERWLKEGRQFKLQPGTTAVGSARREG